MANTLISYNGEDCYYNNYNTKAPFIKTKANNIYLNENCSQMFSGCTQLDSNSFNNFLEVAKMDYAVNCNRMFYACHNLNYNVQIGANVTDCAYMFYSCYKLNYNVQIGANVTNCNSMFASCSNLNANVQIGANVTNCVNMFRFCSNLNQNIYIPASVTNCMGMFFSCKNLNQNIQIPASVTNCMNMFRNCNRLGGSGININININASQPNHDFRRFVQDKNNSLRLNIYCNNLDLLRNNYANGSIVGANINWSYMTNGYRNTVYNIYLYSNYTGNT